MPIDAKFELLRRQQQRIHQLQRLIDELNVKSQRWSSWRLWTFFGGGLLGLLVTEFLLVWLGYAVLLIAMLLFSYAVYRHRRIDRRLSLYRHWQYVKQQHIAQMTLEWEQLPSPISYQAADEHPFASDLNVLGERSLLHLIDTSITYEGGQLLAEWLLQTEPDPAETMRRQQFVQQTRSLWQFRDKLRLYGRLLGVQQRIHGQYLLNWFEKHEAPLGRVLAFASLLAFITAFFFIAFLLGWVAPVFVISLGIYVVLLYQHNDAVAKRFSAVRSLHRHLSRLQAIFIYLENTHHPILRPHLRPFHEEQPSRALRRLTRLMVAASAQQNPFLAFFLNLVIPYDLAVAYLLDRYKAQLEQPITRWLSAWFQLEALNSLANFAYLNPQQTFPHFEEHIGLQAKAIGHPLLKDELRVSNDFEMKHTHDVVIITGSNMAGKSTFLRTLGVNMILAYAGGTVQAEYLRLSWFRLFTCIKVSDSINDGISYFYAEVRRLKALLNALEVDHTYPLFFMIDEIFKGTNNRERLIGSRAYIRAVAQKNGVGLIATHDLELVKLAEELPNIRNFHFREEVVGGRMVFDYQIRQGPCPTTNALKIMALEGLPTE